ncbi:GTPase ObgE [Candidatus Peregrinibacteria bacterium]|nr:MAG: GTPase ObgE [Candidatus Peregrinibacteria bacterium]
MFFDEVSLELEGGKGGNGALFFHREKYVEAGGPDGGDGGNGGSLVLEADENYNTLQHFMGKKHYKAHNGENGFKNDMAGHAGEDLVLKVPVGTLVHDKESDEVIADLDKNGLKLKVAAGGRGGYGNGHFGSSTRQAPMFAELGDIGEFRSVRLELRLVADVGLVGFPSAGKSTLISHVSAAKPKVAAYPFTTLIPNLGVVHLSQFGGSEQQSFVIADMPGIIEGASEGKGLGDAFLKHISRTATLVFVLDPFCYENLTLIQQFEILQKELKAHNPALLKKDYFVVMNKIDSIPEADREALKKEFLKAYPKLKSKFRLISGVSGEGLEKFIFELEKTVSETREKNETPRTVNEDFMEYVPTRFVDENNFDVEAMYEVDALTFEEPVLGQILDAETLPKRNLYKVTGKRIEQISRMTSPEYPDAIMRVADVLKKMGIHKMLIRKGAMNGDFVKIGPRFYEFHEL